MTTRWPREASAGETAGPWGSKGDAMRLVRPLTAAVRPILRNLRIGLPAAGRPEMAPQRIEKIESAPGNGAPMERRPDRDERVGGSAAADRRTVPRRRQAAAQHPAWKLRSTLTSRSHWLA